ncbi:hypothetical protein D350_01085 [Enterococcus faecalis VC1B-1]|uniref:DUF3892 domain-containing protein n=1 Tax=Enterococcus faecalis TaxID=1351 RepID=UPI00037A2EAD|nr:DUF3892 domain-containing protein [Enterococcus faecalis]EPI31857.1 hypothetical protein D350_01085 [Enterococcus faecalis VC1B-1]HAP2945814.1 DUF3892 domain-containing protein [Enterococcus faecalis]
MEYEISAIHYDNNRITQVKVGNNIICAHEVMANINSFYTINPNNGKKVYLEVVGSSPSKAVRDSWTSGSSSAYFRTQPNDDIEDNLSHLPVF